METPKEYMLKEIEIIQDIIRRMAQNSFWIKGWTVTLVIGVLLLKGAEKAQIWVAFIPLVVFWILDAYFLRQERMYRKLYEWAVQNRPQSDEHLFDMNAYRFADQVQSIPRIMVSITLGLFYGGLAVLVVVYGLIVVLSSGCS
ncbi:MAG TPA: hypothetical protein PK777_05585 [Thermoguttaceae bacterium]|nr:hypothetical protein [Thermoguttaceae bacterium]